MVRLVLAFALIPLLSLSGCSSTRTTPNRQAASIVEFLFPGGGPPPAVGVVPLAELKVPLKVGLVFVPDTAEPRFRITEAEKIDLLTRVRTAFERYPFVSAIEQVPSSYLRPAGGFDNLDRVAALLSLDCVVLLSYDQMQYADATGWSWLYWTGIGAYTVEADRYDVLTSVEAAIFEVRSRKLLMRAGGTSQVKGLATLVGLSEKARAARTAGFRDSFDKMIANLHAEVKAFRERAPADRTIRLDLPPGYDPKAARPAPPTR